MAWGKNLAKVLGYLVDTAWPSALAAGLVFGAAGLLTANVPVILSASLYVAAGISVAAVCHRLGRDPWNEDTHHGPAEPWPDEVGRNQHIVVPGVEPEMPLHRDRLAASWPEQSAGRTLH